LTSDGQLVSFIYQADEDHELRIEREGDGFISHLIESQYEIQIEVLEGIIQDNLISAVLTAGGNYQLAIDLEEVFAWKINFFKDLRTGDSFKVLVEKQFLKKQFSGFGQIKAATFQFRRKNISAVYFKPEGKSGGFYTPEGQSLKKQFLKSPLKYTRITSSFTRKRFHPIYKKHMPHLAVDYAAPQGTPIYAISDGEVVSMSRNARSGRYLKLKHRNEYESSYSHLSKYGNHVLKGEKVQQGQIIGYVGSTGAATGPHLCFRLRKKGRSINPLRFQSPGEPDLEEGSKEAFHAIAMQRMKLLGAPQTVNSRTS
jgi:murein DD-endopeptidase MepM/ murein hydrolase activator NlpD